MYLHVPTLVEHGRNKVFQTTIYRQIYLFEYIRNLVDDLYKNEWDMPNGFLWSEEFQLLDL